MNTKNKWLLLAKKKLAKIHLVDGFLLVMMLILMIQITLTLFASTPLGDGRTTVDVVVRSTAAAIFGYFISANFAKPPIETEKSAFLSPSSPIIATAHPKENVLKGQIGFFDVPQQELPEPLLPPHPHTKNNLVQMADLQIFIVGGFTIAFLLILLVARNHLALGQESVASLSQLRDFVCSGVGFLLGTPTEKTK